MASSVHSVNFCDEDVHTSEPLISREEIREKIRKALNLYVGRGRRYSVDELSVGAGVPKRVIQAALTSIKDENYRPLREENLMSVSKFLGAPFVSVWLETMGLGAFELMDGQPPLPRMLTSAPKDEDTAEERKRLIQRLAELEGL